MHVTDTAVVAPAARACDTAAVLAVITALADDRFGVAVVALTVYGTVTA